jgi:hypothetical protein
MRDRHEQAVRQVPQDPGPSAASWLVQYFRETASSTFDDAHVRTATLGNARWEWKYAITQNAYGAAECSGVRKLIQRAKRRERKSSSEPSTRGQRTPPKKQR